MREVNYHCPLCDGLNGTHDEECAVRTVIEGLADTLDGPPQDPLDQVREYHAAMIRRVMAHHGYSTGEIVKTAMSVKAQWYGDKIEWRADHVPIDVADYISSLARSGDDE